MSIKQKAVQYFRQPPERLNCAQTVLKALEGESDLATPERIVALRAAGSGQAEDGICGSLFTAKMALKNPQQHIELERVFILATGSLKCREIRSLKKASCQQCVEIASDFLESCLPLNR